VFEKLAEVVDHYEALEARLGDPEIAADPRRYAEVAKEHADLRELVAAYREYRELGSSIASNRELLDDEDPEMREMARAELSEQETALQALEHTLKLLLLPKDQFEGRDVLLEIRAGAGGDEAGLFAGDLFRMYTKFVEQNRWKMELLSGNPTGIGGFKEVIASISGATAYSRLKYESGVHRVQRVPATESQGRIHTSTCTVAIMPEAEEIDVQIEPGDLKFDIYRSSGPGGQSVNTTDSAVRVTYLPSNIVVTCQDEKSQHKNKAKALKILRSRVLEEEQRRVQAEQRDQRLAQVGTGDRSERIRTYNFPQNRVSDHRIGLTLYALEKLMEGDMNELIQAVSTHFEAEALKAAEKGGGADG
jgi:peptide chain release factor 1